MENIYIEYGLYVLAGIIAILAIFFGISNWVQLGAFSSKLTELEQEIDKKSSEFDLIRRERKTGTVATLATQVPDAHEYPQTQASPDVSASIAQTAPLHDPEANDEAIQVVRNVRNSYGAPETEDHLEHTNLDVLHKEHHPIEQATTTPPEAPAEAPSPIAAEPAPMPPAPTPEIQKLPSIDTSTSDNRDNPTVGDAPGDESPDADVMEVVADSSLDAVPESHPLYNTTPEPPPPRNTEPMPLAGEITISLYSAKQKDADFAAASRILAKSLPGMSRPHVIFDMKNIMFIYEEELAYLEKILAAVIQRSGSMNFVNCQGELHTIMIGRPTLAPHVKAG